MKKTCCIVGSAPGKKLRTIELTLRQQLMGAVDDGYRWFVSGFDADLDLLFAEIVADLKLNYPDIALEAALPYGNHIVNRGERVQQLLSACSLFSFGNKAYKADSIFLRDRKMIYNADRVIGVQDEQEEPFSIRYARVLGKELHVIHV